MPATAGIDQERIFALCETVATNVARSGKHERADGAR
jgi:hypothetical protein